MRDWVSLAVLVPLWVVCFVLSMQSALQPAYYSPLFVSAPAHADDYPTVRGYLPSARDPQSALQAGDRLLRVDEVDLRGVGPVEFFVGFP